MPELLKRDFNISLAHSVAPCTGIPCWSSTGSQMQHSSLSRNLSFKMATPPKPCKDAKQLDFQLHDQDSSSTQSTGQSYPEVVSVGESENGGKSLMLKESGCPGTHGKPEEGQTKSTLSSQDYTSLPSHVNYGHTLVPAPFTYPDTYYHRFAAAYGPHPMVHPQLMLVAPPRVPLPHDLPQHEPIFVNAKQYRAILRRRQYRAKLEAQNKLSKVRKPYLHESRHRHAVNRVRGPGGRFLNQKKLQECNSTTTDSQPKMAPGNSQMTSKMWGSEVCQLGDFKAGNQTTSSSDVTSISNADNIFHQQEFGFSLYPPHIGEPAQNGGGGGLHGYLSVPP